MIYSLYRLFSPIIKTLTQNLGLSSGQCRFTPTCSLYAKQAINKHGIILGSWYAVKRLLQCHPWSKGGYDPIP